MDNPLLKEVVIVFALSIGVLLLCHRIRLPSMIGFLITGVICGPYALSLIDTSDEVHALADIGIVLLLFGIGMEFSLKKILVYKRYFLGAGGLQVALTTLVGFLIGCLLELSTGESLFLGFLLSMSSTAIVIKIQNEKAMSSSPQGLLSIGILIFQDVISVPMLLLTPYLASRSSDFFDLPLMYDIVKGVFVVGVVFLFAIKVVPKALYYVTKTRSRELFLLSVLTICFLVAWLAHACGLSLALGAFLAGLIVSETEFSHEAVGNILPFQAIFTSFFFVSTGMLLNLNFFLHHFGAVISIALLVIALKSLTGGFATLTIGLPLRTAILSSVALAQVGEFSFMLAKNGVKVGLGTPEQYQMFLAVVLVTMICTPALIWLAPKLADLILSSSFVPSGFDSLTFPFEEHKKDHLVIVGYGVAGKNIAVTAKRNGIPYLILEMNPETVRNQKKLGEPIYFGDATHESVLEHANVQHAKAIAIVINDPSSVARIVSRIRHINESVYIIVRTRFIQEMQGLFRVGADEVVPDEFDASMEIVSRLLKKCQTPSEEIEKSIGDLRLDLTKLRMTT